MLNQVLFTRAGWAGLFASATAAIALSGGCAAQGNGTGNPGFSGSDSGSSNGSSGDNNGGGNGGSSGSTGSNGGSSGGYGTNSGSNGGSTGYSTVATSGSNGGGTSGSGSTSGSAGGGSSGTASTGGTAASGTVATSGTTTVASSGTPAAGACAVTSTGGLPLVSSYLSTASGNPGTGGYAFAFADMVAGGSTACLETTTFCGSGSIGIQNPPTYSIYGGGIGVNIAQMMATGAASPPVGQGAATGSGIKYAITAVPTLGLRVIIDNGAVGTVRTDYCAVATAASGTIPWAMFNTKCYDATPDGVALSGPPTMATHIQFQVPSGLAAGKFDFCVTALSFAP